MWEFAGQRYGMDKTSGPGEEGLGLELVEARPEDTGFATGEMIARVFHDDPTGQLTISLYRDDIPVELVEWFVSVTREALPTVR